MICFTNIRTTSLDPLTLKLNNNHTNHLMEELRPCILLSLDITTLYPNTSKLHMLPIVICGHPS